LYLALSDLIGWQGSFAVLATASLIVMLGIVRLIPAIAGGEAIPFKQNFAVFKNRKIGSGYFITLFWIAG